jgi:hypothetical protein
MARLGSKGRPIIVRARTMERAGELVKFCDDRGWIVIAGVEPDKPENIDDLNEVMRLGAILPAHVRWTPSAEHPAPPPTDPCPCGSGRRFKKCCLRR